MEKSINKAKEEIAHDDILIEVVPPPESTENVFNINVGILGHVDSGKTTLSKKLSQVASTAAFDKNPQSKERGITLDLGFSALYIKTPKILQEKFSNERLKNSNYIQITLVDCPGHASLIKTVIAGASIIDTMILVIDAIKGIQTQTVECILLSEILCDKICIAFNKSDLLKSDNEKETKIAKLKAAFSKTKFGSDVPIIPTCSTNEKDSQDINDLIKNLLICIDFDSFNPQKEKFLSFIDHCFNIKNKGTIITGTIIKGEIKVNDEVFFPELSQKKQVKEIQVFKKPVQVARTGDRVGMLIKNLDSQKIERSIICSPNSTDVSYCEGGLLLVKKIHLFKQEISSNSKYYLMLGNQGVNARFTFFSSNEAKIFENFDFNNIRKTVVNKTELYKTEFPYVETIQIDDSYAKSNYYFAYVRFDSKTLIPNNMIFVGSKIDINISEKTNRLAFYGKMIDTNVEEVLNKLKIFKMKKKEGKIIRIKDGISIVQGLFKKNSNYDDYVGKAVHIRQDKSIKGKIISSFGQTGKMKVEFEKNLEEIKLKNNDGEEIDYKGFEVELEYKKYLKNI